METGDLVKWTNIVRNLYAFLAYVVDVPDVQRNWVDFERLVKYVSDTYDMLRMVLCTRLTEKEFRSIEPIITVRDQIMLLNQNLLWDAAYDMYNADGKYEYWHGHPFEQRPDHNRVEFYEAVYKWVIGQEIYVHERYLQAAAQSFADAESSVPPVVEVEDEPDADHTSAEQIVNDEDQSPNQSQASASNDAGAPKWLRNVHTSKPFINYDVLRRLPRDFNRLIYLTGVDYRCRTHNLRSAFPVFFRFNKVHKCLVSEMPDTSGFHFAWLEFHTIADAIRFMVGMKCGQLRPEMNLTGIGAELKVWYGREEWVVNGVRLGPYH
ncbi:hypothetical protein AAVH_15621 [Aphelenchoides avenae]|nr:hypothetical protein AAVH_15621 [Aphelenchus avenae]